MIYDVLGNSLNSCYNASGSALVIAYDADGETVWNGGIETDYSNPTITNYKTISTQNTQGMDIYNDVLFQFRGSGSNLSLNDLVCLYDWGTGSTIKSNMAMDCGHSNAVAFSKTFYEQTDEFPLIYCGDWFDPIVHVNRPTRSSSTHIYDIVMNVSDTGYHCNPCIDFDNQIMYTVGYYLNSTETATGNHCIVCKWDIANMTDNGDGTFTPTLLETYNLDFIYVMQDLKFNDGYMWITSGYASSPQYLQALNPSTGEIVYTITMPITTEIEGLVWQRDNQTGLWFAYVGFQGGIYYKIVFPELEVIL